MKKAVFLAVMLLSAVHAQRWTAASPVPTLPSGRQVDDGSWLETARTPDGLMVFAAKGNRTQDFYRYDPVMDSWTGRALVPLGIENKALDQGARAVWDGANSLYMTKGNNSLGFYRFDIAGDSWFQLPDVPLGSDSLLVRGGSDVVFLRKDSIPYVYLLKGEAGEFYRINLNTTSWEALPHAPGGSQPEWFDGSWLEYDGGLRIYAHKARADEFWAFDVSRNEWESRPLSGMPLIGRRGVPIPSSHGGSAVWYNGAAYALKGNNTPELWRYHPAADSWAELDLSPVDIGGGGALALGDSAPAGERYFFALAGNEQPDFLQYRLPFIGVEETHDARPRSVLRFAACPARGSGARVSYSLVRPGAVRLDLFDTGGRVRWHREFSAGAGQFSLELPVEQNGVYLLRALLAGDEAAARLVKVR